MRKYKKEEKEEIDQVAIGKTVESIDFTSGEFEILFTDGSRIEVELDGHYDDKYLTVSATPR